MPNDLVLNLVILFKFCALFASFVTQKNPKKFEFLQTSQVEQNKEYLLVYRVLVLLFFFSLLRFTTVFFSCSFFGFSTFCVIVSHFYWAMIIVLFCRATAFGCYRGFVFMRYLFCITNLPPRKQNSSTWSLPFGPT